MESIWQLFADGLVRDAGWTILFAIIFFEFICFMRGRIKVRISKEGKNKLRGGNKRNERMSEVRHPTHAVR